MKQKDFFAIWAREAEAALGAKKADMVDQMLLDLPLMKAHGQHVHVDVTPVRRLEDFDADVQKRLQ